MASINNGPHGRISGKIGSVVYVNTRYGNYVRSKPSFSKPRTNSALQLITISKFKLVQALMTALKQTIRKGFTAYNPAKRARDVAMSYNLEHATLPQGDQFVLNWEELALAKGYPNPMQDISIDMDEAKHELTVSWDIDQALADRYSLDKYTCHMVLLHMQDNGVIFTHGNNVHYPLDHHSQSLTLIPQQPPKDWHIYVFFYTNRTDNTCTDSMYLGMMSY